MEQSSYYQNKLNSLTKAITSFARLMSVNIDQKDEFESDVYKNAAVQKFECAVELDTNNYKNCFGQRESSRG
jgi:hypothetical protein